MKKIFEYKLGDFYKQEIQLPKGAHILSIGAQQSSISSPISSPVMWVVVNPEETEMEKRTFITYNIGEEILDDYGLTFIGTVHLDNGLYVRHIFESGRPRPNQY